MQAPLLAEREPALGTRLTKGVSVGSKLEFVRELPAPSFGMIASKDWSGNKVGGDCGAEATERSDKKKRKENLSRTANDKNKRRIIFKRSSDLSSNTATVKHGPLS